MAKAATSGSSTTQRPLIASRRVLDKALSKAARDAQRLADAFGVKVPVARDPKR
jgi:hypothetical protein